MVRMHRNKAFKNYFSFSAFSNRIHKKINSLVPENCDTSFPERKKKLRKYTRTEIPTFADPESGSFRALSYFKFPTFFLLLLV